MWGLVVNYLSCLMERASLAYSSQLDIKSFRAHVAQTRGNRVAAIVNYSKLMVNEVMNTKQNSALS